LLKGTASAVPQTAGSKTRTALPKAGVERNARNDQLAIFRRSRQLLTRSQFFTPIRPTKAHKWKNTRIHQGGGKPTNPQIVTNARCGSFLTSRIEDAFKETISEKQADRIDDAMRQNPFRALGSESIRVSLC
jgi:hypothetical protein